MSVIPNWSPSGYYVYGDRVTFSATIYELVVAGSTPGIFGAPPPANPTAWILSTAGGGVASITTNGADPLSNNINLEAGVGVGLAVTGQTIQISNLNPSVVQQGIIALKDSVGATSTSFTPQMTCSVSSTAGATPSASYSVTNSGSPPTATSNFALNLQIPPIPTVSGTAPGITVSGSAAAGGYTITNGGVTAIGAAGGIAISGSTGDVTISNSGVTSLRSGGGIGLNGPNGDVEVTNTGVLALTAGTGISVSGTNANITISNTQPGGVQSVSADAPLSSTGGTNPTLSYTGLSSLTSANASTGITIGGTSSNPSIANSGVTSLTAGTGISVSASSGAITISTTSPTPINIDIEGLQNKLGIITVLPLTSDVVALASNNDGSPATAIVPDDTPPTSSTTPTGTPCWLYTKPVGGAGFNWFMYNPRFGNPTAPLPYKKYSSNPADDRIKSVWALVQPAVNTNIYTAGVVALNLYSFDSNNPPSPLTPSTFYNTRWAYSNSAGINSGQTGVNLYAGYTYLLYAYDAPRITNQTGVGQPDVQDWGLRDPYDIYTDVHHIPLQNCVVAFNRWTDGTNYITWTGTTVFLSGQTCIFSGFGGNPNGIFYTAVLGSTNQPPVSATGVPNTAFWTAISPQPSSYASQPILSANLTGISGTSAAGWTVGPLLRVLSMGYTTGPTPNTQTSSIRYVLN